VCVCVCVDTMENENDCAIRRDCVLKYLLKYHLPLGLLIGVLFGYGVPAPGKALSDFDTGLYGMGTASLDIFIIFLISGIKLKTDDIKRALKAYVPLMYGIIAILALTPCAALAFVNMDGTLSVPEFAYGLAIFALMPTTLSSGVILTRDARGNVALALLLTVASNLLAVAIIPFSLGLVFSSAGDLDVTIDPVPMIVKLLLSILLPLCLGKTIREMSQHVREFATTYNVHLKLFSSFCLIMVPWMKVSSASDEMSKIDGSGIAELVGLGIGLHITYLLMNTVATRALHLQPNETRAVTIMCSQKTLPVAVAVIDFLPDDESDENYLGEPGIMVVACILAHFVQIVLDALLASYWGQRVSPEDEQLTDADEKRVELATASKGASLEEDECGEKSRSPCDCKSV